MNSGGEICRSAVCVAIGGIITFLCIKIWQANVGAEQRGNPEGHGDNRERQEDREGRVDGTRQNDRGIQGNAGGARKVPQEHDEC